MVSIFKFLYALVIFISLFLVLSNSTQFPLTRSRSPQFQCSDDNDCPWDMCLHISLDPMCISDTCECLIDF
ncbi:unnamed protein product [Lathyrus oleraceus]